MKALEKFVTQHNAFQSIFGRPAILLPLTQADVTHLTEVLDNELSPENLSCDGELAPAMVRARARTLNGAAEDLAKFATKNGFTQPKTYCI
jgi:hypothetical protein